MENRLFEIIRDRHSIRSFGSAMPDRESIGKIAASAVYAPYGGATGIPLNELRKIYIFERGTPSMDRLVSILMGQIAGNSRKLKRVVTFIPPLRKKLGAFSDRLRKISENGIPALDQAAYIIVVAEKKGFPPVAKQSLAHTMQNMWLTATDEKLGFQLVSAIGTLNKNKEFTTLLGLKEGHYALDGCAIGVPVKELTARKTKETGKFIKWM